MENKKVDVNAWGINEKLAKRYNALVNFIKKETVLSNGCFNQLIIKVDYVRNENKESLFSTDDYIVIYTDDRMHWINNPKCFMLDRKYKIVEIVDYKEI